jgi:rhodanese-related sulfurtransferase
VPEWFCGSVLVGPVVNFFLKEEILKKLSLFVVVLLLCATNVLAGDENFITADDFKAMLDKNTPVVIADIQKAKNFQKQHFFDAVETDAYPVKKDAEKEQLGKIVELFQKTGNPVVIVGPRGGSGAKRAYRYLLDQGVPADKLFILKGGVREWPYEELLIDTAGGCA